MGAAGVVRAGEVRDARAGSAMRRSMAYMPYLIIAALGAALLVQAVRLLWAVLVPISPLGDWQPPRAQILDHPQRLALLNSFDPFFRGAMAGSGPVQVTAINIMLHGVTMNEATGGGSAILAGADGVQNSYAVGDEVMAGVTLAAVAFDHVVLDRGGARETLFMEQGDGGAVPIVGAPVAAAGASGAGPVDNSKAEAKSAADGGSAPPTLEKDRGAGAVPVDNFIAKS